MFFTVSVDDGLDLSYIVSADDWRRSWSVSFSWRREHFCMDWYNCGWRGNCLWGIIVQALSTFSSRLPFQTSPDQIWDDVLPSKCWSIWEHMPWYSPGINHCACRVKGMQEMADVKMILRLGETNLFEDVWTRW